MQQMQRGVSRQYTINGYCPSQSFKVSVYFLIVTKFVYMRFSWIATEVHVSPVFVALGHWLSNYLVVSLLPGDYYICLVGLYIILTASNNSLGYGPH